MEEENQPRAIGPNSHTADRKKSRIIPDMSTSIVESVIEEDVSASPRAKGRMAFRKRR